MIRPLISQRMRKEIEVESDEELPASLDSENESSER
jgi:hypothetical protein